MIPQTLQLDGFLSYQTPVSLDFNQIHLACISGHNGAGKSSLLDAITWALFGQARSRGEAVINLKRQSAEVAFTFAYEGAVYRIIRRLERGKGSTLEFQIQQTDSSWKAISERSIRATQKRIEHILRLDYETFINAAFFLQGRADQFTQQSPGTRKEILGKILGLETWEIYRQRTVERRRAEETHRERLDAELASIDRELAEEPQRRQTLAHVRAELEALRQQLQTRQSQLSQAQTLSTSLDNQRHTVSHLKTAIDQAQADLEARQARYQSLQTRAESFKQLMQDAENIQDAYNEWQTLRAELQTLDALAEQFREQEKALNAPRAKIAAEKIRLEQACNALLQASQENEAHKQALAEHLHTLQEIQTQIARLEERAETIAALREKAESNRQKYLQLSESANLLKTKTQEINERLKTLAQDHSNQCPTCGQALTEAHKTEIMAELETQGKALADQFRAQRDEMKALKEDYDRLEQEIHLWESSQKRQLDTLRLKEARLEENVRRLQEQTRTWEHESAPRLAAIQAALAEESYAMEARAELAQMEAQLQALGYDAARHAAIRARLNELSDVETRRRELDSAAASLREIESQLQILQQELETAQKQIAAQRQAWQQQQEELTAAESQLPDIPSLKRSLLHLQERVNQKARQLGAAEQKVRVLDDLRQRKSALQSQRDTISQTIIRYQQLEKAFGKNGAPALIIEQALPQIEAHANDILERLSDGQMSLRFKTQAQYKDKTRHDLKETLEIEISDGAGVRGYEMFSGGEAFRIDFSVRLALSKVLAQRSGAHLQMLVIDEGFGSQDSQGKQRLIEAINAIQNDFRTILVITHLDELKDAFPTRIEINKTPDGSRIAIL